MSRHILIKEVDSEYAARFPNFETEYRYRIECPEGNGCTGWIECRDPHEVHGISAADGPYDCDHAAPWCDEEEFEFHGVIHTWRDGHGWTVPYKGCIVAFGDWEPPDELPEDSPPGRFVVDDEWEDTSVYLILAKDVEAAS